MQTAALADASSRNGYRLLAKRPSRAGAVDRDLGPGRAFRSLVSEALPTSEVIYPRRRRFAPTRGGAYTFGGGSGSRTGSGRIFARMPLSIRMRGESG